MDTRTGCTVGVVVGMRTQARMGPGQAADTGPLASGPQYCVCVCVCGHRSVCECVCERETPKARLAGLEPLAGETETKETQYFAKKRVGVAPTRQIQDLEWGKTWAMAEASWGCWSPLYVNPRCSTDTGCPGGWRKHPCSASPAFEWLSLPHSQEDPLLHAQAAPHPSSLPQQCLRWLCPITCAP